LLSETGEGLAGILDKLRDQDPERFELLNRELQIWMPEFDRILFETPQESMRSFLLRSREGQFKIGAHDLSQGTLLALAILTMAYLPDPPPIVAMEEPDRGIHPRLLRHVKDAIYRLAYPESVGEKRDPAQVIVTTHSPYMLDLFRDRPEDIVIAEKVEDNVQFHRLSERKDLDEILENIHLGDAWYSGILGGVPAEK
jgi:predicted ATPase